jgi:transglutaminase-like putative cysteine protease
MSRSPAAGPAAAALLALLILGTAWTALYEGPSGARVLALGGLALAPAAVMVWRRGGGAWALAAAVVALPLALALATRRSPADILLLRGDAWAQIRGILPDGLREGSDAGLPVSVGDFPQLVALLDLALVALGATAAWQLMVRRRPIAALLAVGGGLAYRWTVEPPGSPGLAGALALAGLVGILALSSWDGGGRERAVRRAGGAAALGGAAVVLAAALGAGPAQAGDAWWRWQDWEIGAGGPAASAALDLHQRYAALDWPGEPRVALVVKAARAVPIRAVSLDVFDGVSFTLPDDGATTALPLTDGTVILPFHEVTAGPVLVQRVSVVGARSQLVLAGGRPVSVTGGFSGTADLVGDSVRLDRGLEPGDRYTVRTVIPQPRPADLVAAPAYDQPVPAHSTELRPGFWEDPVDVPVWGSDQAGLDPAGLGPYAAVRDLALRVTRGAETPYAAVNRIESYLRRNYTYDEDPPYPTSVRGDWPANWPEGRPPLVDFLFGSRRGFCQHFAGSMAVMLRSLGIPARVAVGYTGGRFDSAQDAFVVVDRDAHSWVEVWFPGEGWLPFDPTPGRAAPNPASVSSPDYAPTQADIDLQGLESSAVEPPSIIGGPASEADTAPAETEPEAAAPAPAPAQGGSTWSWVLLALAVPFLMAPAARAVRRVRGRRRGDDRDRVVAAARDLEATLAALGWAPPATGTPAERAEAVRARTGVDPSPLYRRAARARFAAEPPPPGAAGAAWREAARLRRAISRRAPAGRRVRAALGLPRLRRGTVGG